MLSLEEIFPPFALRIAGGPLELRVLRDDDLPELVEREPDNKLSHQRAGPHPLLGSPQPRASQDQARLREVGRVQILHTNELSIATDNQGEAPLVGSEGRALRPPPPQRGRREPVRRPGREGLLVPLLEERHGQVRTLDATADELDQFRQIVVAQDPELQWAAADPQRERGEDFLQGQNGGLFPKRSAREQRVFCCRRRCRQASQVCGAPL